MMDGQVWDDSLVVAGGVLVESESVDSTIPVGGKCGRGRPRLGGVCGVCGGVAVVRGMCKWCYQREYMKMRRDDNVGGVGVV